MNGHLLIFFSINMLFCRRFHCSFCYHYLQINGIFFAKLDKRLPSVSYRFMCAKFILLNIMAFDIFTVYFASSSSASLTVLLSSVESSTRHNGAMADE